ncbi:MAG: hydrogenase maturation protease [Proteobacteria bacterium]|nr:hydrogenase maturation protease [Pseudomonadota bacterium]
MADDIAKEHSPKVLIMGIGNLLLGDEGVGVHAIYELEKVRLPHGVKLLDVGTAFIDAVSHMNHIDKLIIIDAITCGKKPGTVYRIPITPDSFTSYSTSIHGMSVIHMMKFAQCSLPDTVSFFGIEPEVIDWSMEISKPVAESMPRLINAVLSEISHSNEALYV